METTSIEGNSPWHLDQEEHKGINKCQLVRVSFKRLKLLDLWRKQKRRRKLSRCSFLCLHSLLMCGTNTDLLGVGQELQQVFEQLCSIDLSFSLSDVLHNGAIGPESQRVHSGPVIKSKV